MFINRRTIRLSYQQKKLISGNSCVWGFLLHVDFNLITFGNGLNHVDEPLEKQIY